MSSPRCRAMTSGPRATATLLPAAVAAVPAQGVVLGHRPPGPHPPPARVTHREKWRLALDMLDTLATWGMTPPVVVADAAYGTNAHLRAALSDRGIDYVLAIRADVSAHPFDGKPVAPDRNGPVGCWPQPRYRHPAPSVA